MPAKLRVIPPSTEPFDVVLGNTATIGRATGNTVPLSTSQRVSRQHVLIRCHNGYQYQIVDLGSRNGTFVNDKRVITPVTLKSGAQIRVADTSLIFEQTEGELDQLGVVGTTAAGSTGDTGTRSESVALLVCDIRGFATIAEKISGSELAQQLGAWFREAANLVTKSGGTIDKFIGDAFLSYWSRGDAAQVDCARVLEAARKLVALAATMTWRHNESFRIAVALHYGPVTCGNVGVDAQRDATIIGDAVNTVFRLEAVMKQLDQVLILSHDFRERLAERRSCADLGEHALKGKRQLVRIYGTA